MSVGSRYFPKRERPSRARTHHGGLCLGDRLRGRGLRDCAVADRRDRRCARADPSRVWRAVRESDRSTLAGATERAFGSAARQNACAWPGDVRNLPLNLGIDRIRCPAFSRVFPKNRCERAASGISLTGIFERINETVERANGCWRQVFASTLVFLDGQPIHTRAGGKLLQRQPRVVRAFFSEVPETRIVSMNQKIRSARYAVSL
jgi:hypothetical protein